MAARTRRMKSATGAMCSSVCRQTTTSAVQMRRTSRCRSRRIKRDASAVALQPVGRGTLGSMPMPGFGAGSHISARNSPLPQPISSDRLAVEVVAVDPAAARAPARTRGSAARSPASPRSAPEYSTEPTSKRGVEDEAARAAEREPRSPRGKRVACVAVVEQQAAVDRDVPLLVEDPQIGRVTGRAGVGDRVIAWTSESVTEDPRGRARAR